MEDDDVGVVTVVTNVHKKDLLYGVKGKFEIKSHPTSESHKVVDRAE